MRILMTGRGTSGSWEIRGRQLGRAIGAEIIPQATKVAGYDVAIVVKRAPSDLLERLHKAKVPILWDIVDAWPQPIGNTWDREASLQWLEDQIAVIKPAGIVAATKAMAVNCMKFGVPVLALAHHCRPGLRSNPIRDEVRLVGYEGGEAYLGRWRAVIERECAHRGWRFVVNPQDLAELDILTVMRDCQGWAPRNWKSNVKLANAQGSGTPVICNRESGYTETASGAELWADTEAELIRAFDALMPRAARMAASSRLYMAAQSLESISGVYRQWLQSKF